MSYTADLKYLQETRAELQRRKAAPTYRHNPHLRRHYTDLDTALDRLIRQTEAAQDESRNTQRH